MIARTSLYWACFALPAGKPVSFLCDEYKVGGANIDNNRETFCRMDATADVPDTRCAATIVRVCNDDPFKQTTGSAVGNLCDETYNDARLASCADHNTSAGDKDDTCTGANGAINIVETHCIGLPAEDDIYGLCTYNGKATNSDDYLTWRGNDASSGIIGVGRASQDDDDANLIAGSGAGLTLGASASDISGERTLTLADGTLGGDSTDGIAIASAKFNGRVTNLCGFAVWV